MTRRRPPLLALAVTAATLSTLAVLGYLLFSVAATTRGVPATRIVVTQTANGERDLLIFERSVDRLPFGGSVRSAALWRALALQQLATLARQQPDASLDGAVRTLAAIDLAAVAAADDPRPAIARIDAQVAAIELKLKILHDERDQHFQTIIAGALSARARAQRALAALITLTLAVAGAWAWQQRRRTRSDLRAAYDALHASEGRFRSLVQHSSDLTLLTGADGVIVYASPAALRITGIVPDALAGTALSALAEDPKEVAHVVARLAGEPGEQLAVAFTVTGADGVARVLDGRGSNLLGEAAVGALVFNLRDVTERRRLERELAGLAFHDPLTGLANRALLHDRIRQASARGLRDGSSGAALILIDLDDFKAVNDGLGHAEGDLLLGAVARRLEQSVRAGDTVARLGGDEFVIFAPQIGEVDASALAERVVAALAEPLAVGQRTLPCSASVGLCCAPVGELTPEDLLRDADLAMYSVKAAGKGSWTRFEPAMREAATVQLELRTDLHRALAGDELVLHFQPILDLADERVTGFEALVRWQHPVHGLLGPNRFISLAERTGLIEPLGAWVIEAALAALGRIEVRTGRSDLTMSVNLSPRQLEGDTVAAAVREALAATGIAPGRLMLEVTEGLFLADTSAVSERLGELRELGVGLALDDFGTGFSSLGYLDRLPIDVLKIDRSFVSSLDGDHARGAVAAAIVRLAEVLELDTVAEGVETPAQLAALRALGCRRGQGYLFSPPVPEPAAALAASV